MSRCLKTCVFKNKINRDILSPGKQQGLQNADID